MRLRRLAVALLIFSGGAAAARVFNYKDAALGAFVRGTGGFSQLAQDTFANEAGAGTSVNGSTKYNYGAEIGFVVGMGPNTHLRFGAEMIQENPVKGEGTGPASLKYYDLTSSVFVFNPNVAFEQVFKSSGSLRYYFVLGLGYANVTAVNDYKMTNAGTSNLGKTDFKETMEANVISGQAAMGLETLFTDNVTFLADFGYRYLPVRALKYKSDVTNFMGTYGKGDTVLNSDGSNRTMNLGGLFGGVSFRFYLNFL